MTFIECNHLMKKFKLIVALTLISTVFACKQKETKKEVEIAVNATKEPTASEEKITSFQDWKKQAKPIVSAHRGGPYPGFPENAIETFENISKQTSVVIECDVSMTKDSVLVLMHDKTLDRTTTGKGAVKEATYEELQKLQLVDNNGTTTSFKIPTLDEVLSWGKGKVLFTLDVKRGVPFEKVMAFVEKHNAESYAAIITYRMQDAEKVYALNNKVMISISLRDEGALAQLKKVGIPTENVLAFVGTREPEKVHYEKLKALGIKTILGTLGNLDKSAVAKGNDKVYLMYVANGANIIATDRPLEVAKVLNSK